MQATRLRVTQISEQSNGDRSVHLILTGRDGTGAVQDIRFLHCTSLLTDLLENLDVGEAELAGWYAAHQDNLVASEFLQAKMQAASDSP
jgi:hypothetical protein